MRKFGRGGGFARAVDADDGNHGRTRRGLDQIGLIRAKTLLHFSTRNGKHVQAGAALGFIGVS